MSKEPETTDDSNASEPEEASKKKGRLGRMEERMDAMEEAWSEKTIQDNRRIIQIITLLGIGLSALLGFLAYRAGLFTEKEVLVNFIEGFGFWGPLIFILIQILQCIVPILPGGITLIIGVYLFGPVWGFIYNYIGIILGSVGDFWLARIFGTVFVRSMVKEETYQKYTRWMANHEKKVNIAYVIIMLLPFAPDDFICMLAGLSKMKFSYFFFNLLWAKIPSMLAYSLFLNWGIQKGGQWLEKFKNLM